MDDKRGKKVSNGDDYCFISEIPIPLLHEIFFRLPIKDVMRCKSVRPDWKKLLSDPNFSQNYAKNSPYTALLHYYNPLPDDDSSVPRMHLLEICDESGDYEMSLIRQVPNYLLNAFTYLGSCNGFLCMQMRIGDRKTIYVNNPIWGDTIKLPELVRADPNYWFQERYEFGFSPATNKFKVMRMLFNLDCETVGCEIFTVGVDRCWRPMPTSLTLLHLGSKCTTLNGFFYWISIDWKDSTVGGPDLISSFDLAEEKFGQISLPPSLLLDRGLLELGVFGNQLVLLCFVVKSQQISIYKMNINSVVESWTRVVISSSWFPPSVRNSLVPVAELQNGVMLFIYGDSLISCNVEQKRCSKIRLERVRNPGPRLKPSPRFFSPSFSLHAQHIVESEHCVWGVLR